MSEVYKEKKQITVFDVVIMAFVLLVCLPILPLNILYVFLMLKTERKENFIMLPCIALVIMLCAKIGLFFRETIQIAVLLVKGLLNRSFDILSYGQYSLTSWIILIAVSFAVASYAVKRIRYNRKKEEAGIISLERQFGTNGGLCY